MRSKNGSAGCPPRISRRISRSTLVRVRTDGAGVSFRPISRCIFEIGARATTGLNEQSNRSCNTRDLSSINSRRTADVTSANHRDATGTPRALDSVADAPEEHWVPDHADGSGWAEVDWV